MKNTLIIFTSDHGEPFGEHTWSRFSNGHGYAVFQEDIKVPLIIRLPDKKARYNLSHIEPASLADIMPTILGYLKITPPIKMMGINLLDNSRKDLLKKNQRLIPSSAFYEGEVKAIFEGNLKYMKNISGYHNPIDEALYDLEKDPLEQNNLADQLPEECKRMRLKLEEFTHWAENFLDAKPEKAELKDELKEQLRALGYLQ